jgi:hypothetical protein
LGKVGSIVWVVAGTAVALGYIPHDSDAKGLVAIDYVDLLTREEFRSFDLGLGISESDGDGASITIYPGFGALPFSVMVFENPEE